MVGGNGRWQQVVNGSGCDGGGGKCLPSLQVEHNGRICWSGLDNDVCKFENKYLLMGVTWECVVLFS